MNKKLICGILSALLLCTTVLPSVAATFPDVTEDSFGWALEAVEEMVEDGIIKGYTDNTFKPERTVTKMESLVLSARILGYTAKEMAPFAEFAGEYYADVLESYDIVYKDEVAFLLYKDIISEKELAYYIGGENANQGMKRYEVAKLLTRVMGAEKEIDAGASTSEYDDSADIPADAKPYVRFVTDAGIMNGMGDGTFGPLGEVNRAQIATLLYRVRGLLKETYTVGTVKAVDTNLESFTVVDSDGEEEKFVIPYEIDLLIKQDGYREDFGNLSLGADIIVTARDGVLYAVDALSNEPDQIFVGGISAVNTKDGKSTIGVFPISDTNDVTTYPIAADCAITYEGNPAKVSDLKRLQGVTLQIREGQVVVIEAKDRERTIKGTIEEIGLEPGLSFSIVLSDGTTEKYEVADSATATRNKKTAKLNEILVGDKVTVVLRYERIYTVTATSTKSTEKGTIEEIRIATMPSIKIRSGNNVTEFSLSRDCSYTVDGKTATIYDLRLGANITANVESETVTSLTSTAPSTNTATMGTIEAVNTAYGFITITTEDADGNATSIQVFTKRNNLKVIDSTDGATKAVRDLKPGMSVSVTGVTTNGAFEATAIIIMP